MRKTMFLLRILIISIILLNNFSFSQDLKLKRYSIREGLPTQEITGVVQDSIGYIWVSTNSGLVKYDGVDWEIFIPNKLLSNYSYSQIYKDNNQQLWAISNTENPFILKISYNISERIFINPDLLDEFEVVKGIKVLYKNKVNEIFVYTSFNKILSYKNGSWEKINLHNVHRLYSIEIFNQKLIFSADNGIFQIEDGLINKLNQFDDVTFNNVMLLKKKYINDVEVLFLLSEKKLHKFENNKISLLTEKILLENFDDIYSTSYLDVNKRGHIFFGNKSHFYCLNSGNKIVEEYLEFEELQYAGGTNIITDSEDVIWLATLRGLYKILQTPFSNLKNYVFINYNEVPSLHRTKDNKIVIGQYGKVSVLNKGKLKTYTLPGNQFINNTTARVMDIKSDNNNDIWFTVVPNGVFKIANNKLQHLFYNDSTDYTCLIFKPNGEGFFGGSRGLFSLKDGKLQDLNTGIGPIRRLRLVDNNELGICSPFNGVYFSKDSKFINYKPSSSLLASTYDLLQIDKDRYWIATKGGLAELNINKNSYTSIFPREITEQLYSINRDSEGAIWLGSNNGFIKIIDNKIIKYTSVIGLTGSEANRAAFIIDEDEKVWLGTELGLSIYDKKYGNLPKHKPNCVISNVAIDGQTIENLSEDIIIPNKAKLVIKYRGLSFIDEKSVSYRLKLYDEDNKLVFERITERNNLELFALKPGNYKLYIWSINPVFNETIIPARLSMTVEEDFYSSIWLYLIIFIGSSIITVAIYYTVGQRKYAKRLEKEVEEKTSEVIEEINKKNKFESQLKSSEEKYRGLFDHSVIGIFQIDLNGKFLTVNNACYDLLGYANEYNISNLPNIVDVIINKNDHDDLLKLSMENKFLLGEKYSIKRPDETEIQVRCNARLIDEGGDKVFIEGTLEDITKSVLAENALVLAKQKAEHSEKIKSEFLAQMSHEIRTPINVILSFSQLLKEEINENLETEYEDFFQGMDKAGRRIIRTIDLLLNVSEMQTGGYDYHPKKLNLLDDIMTPLFLEYKSLALDKKIDLKLFCEKHLELFGDEYTVMQIFANIIDNAIKYTDTGSVEISSEEKDGVIIKVKDSGIGISEEYLPYLFSPFSQEEQGYTRKYEGNGLGLTLVKKYCDLNKAEISVESTKGKGTTIAVHFKS